MFVCKKLHIQFLRLLCLLISFTNKCQNQSPAGHVTIVDSVGPCFVLVLKRTISMRLLSTHGICFDREIRRLIFDCKLLSRG